MSTDVRSYRVHHLLGEGGFGAVYRADLIGPGGFAKPVALKLLNAEMRDIDEVAQRMRDEARMLGLLRHRAIVQVDGLVMLDGRWAIVMEYVQGVDLSLLGQHGPVPLGPALEIIEETAGALHVAYDEPGPSGVPLRVLHRDIKPHNIQLTAQGEVKVLDFGIARAEFDNREAKTRSMLFGSAIYMAPERLDFVERHEGDVYSLGTVLYELLVAEQFGKAQANPKRHAEQVERAIARLVALQVPKDAIDLFVAMVAYEPEDRPSAHDVARRARVLKRQVDGRPLIEWAEEVVPKVRASRDATHRTDALSGKILQETSSGSIAARDVSSEPAVASKPEAPRSPPRASLPADRGVTVMAKPAPAPSPTATGSVGRRVAFAGGAVALLGVAGALLAVVAVVAFLWSGVGQGPAATDGAVAAASMDPGPVAVGAEAPEVTSNEAPTGDPVAETSAVAAPGPTEPVATEPTAAVEATVDDVCGGLAALEPVAATGALTSVQTTCLRSWADDEAHKLVDRRKVGLVLLVDDHEACKGGRGCVDYETTQRWYFAELDASDPNLMYLFVAHLWNQGDRGLETDQEIYRWSERALERKGTWKAAEYVKNVDQLYEIRARVAYRMWVRKSEAGDPSASKAASVARIAAVDWLDNRVSLGKDPSEPLGLCESVTGSSEACDRGQDDAPAITIVTFVSQPLGATLFVNGRELGKAPMTAELAHGAHEVKMVLGDGTEAMKAIVVGPKDPVRWIWKSAEGAWVSGY